VSARDRKHLLDYFAAPGVTSDLDRYHDRIVALTSDPVELIGVVQGLLIHEGAVARRKLSYPPERFTDRRRTGASAIVERILQLDAAPLDVERPWQNRMIGYCYHFALLYCALLRAKGVPARTRCGFAAYFRAGAWIDHWVVERWEADGWVVTDPDAGRAVVAADAFRNGGIAWSLCRAGRADPYRHGNYALWGWDELRGTLINDLGALNKVEVGHWDWCTLIDVADRAHPQPALDRGLDPLARIVSDDRAFDDWVSEFERRRDLRPPL
jgi:Transglutaminase-like superfamily